MRDVSTGGSGVPIRISFILFEQDTESSMAAIESVVAETTTLDPSPVCARFRQPRSQLPPTAPWAAVATAMF